MKRIVLLFLLIQLCNIAYNQTIRGIIMDKISNKRIIYAAIFINGTHIGTYSNQNGQFILDITNYQTMPISISALGYSSKTLTKYSYDKELYIYLTPKINELPEVFISANANQKERRQNLKLFKQQFLGSTNNAIMCEITNTDDH